MNDRAYPFRAIALLGFALLVVLSVPAMTEESVAKAACHTVTTCPTALACSSWSAYYDCGAPFCGVAAGCGDCGEIGPCPGPALKQRRERYRVCFGTDPECVEYQRTTVTLGCGC